MTNIIPFPDRHKDVRLIMHHVIWPEKAKYVVTRDINKHLDWLAANRTNCDF